jgi:hypothetical protein
MMQRMVPSQFLKTTLKPAGPGFPLEAPSKLILMKSGGGGDQRAGLLKEVGCRGKMELPQEEPGPNEVKFPSHGPGRPRWEVIFLCPTLQMNSFLDVVLNFTPHRFPVKMGHSRKKS